MDKAIMAVRIEDPSSLAMNEFFDYGGNCYAVSRSRMAGGTSDRAAANMEDFFEGTVRTRQLDQIPVVFLCADSEKDDVPSLGQGALYICGIYRRATVMRCVVRPTLFLEGNIVCRSRDALLFQSQPKICAKNFGIVSEDFSEKLYQVIECSDPRYDRLMTLFEAPEKAGRVKTVTYASAKSYVNHIKFKALEGIRSRQNYNAREISARKFAFCIQECMTYASRLMSDGCHDISEIRTLKDYGQLAQLYNKTSADGYYYEAMADEQLGFVKDGLKTVNRALALEPDGSDLMALKANLLIGLHKYDEALKFYSEAWDISGDDSYLLMMGRVYFLIGNVDMAYKTYRRIQDETLLEDAGINLKDMERRWPFVVIRGLKNLLKRR